MPFVKSARLDLSSPPLHDIAINKRRLLRDLNAVSRIGIGDHGSVTRLVFSIKELRSRQFLVHQMRQIGLQIHIDRIGIFSANLKVNTQKRPRFSLGRISIPFSTEESSMVPWVSLRRSRPCEPSRNKNLS